MTKDEGVIPVNGPRAKEFKTATVISGPPHSTIETILEREISGAVSEDLARSRSEELICALHPRLKPAAIRAKLALTAPDGSPQWLSAAFWAKEIDLVLIEGIHHGRQGQRDVIRRLRGTWPQLDANILEERMEKLANHGLPKFLHEDFWREEGIDSVLLAGLKTGGQAIFQAVGKVGKMHRELRVEVIWARVRRLRKQCRKRSPKGMRCTWTNELEQELRGRCAIEGLSTAVTEICKKTGWSRASVARRAHKLGVPVKQRGRRNAWTEADRNFLVQSVGHVPVKTIARELGRTENAVWCKIWEEGLRARYDMDHSQRELCLKLNVRARVARGWIEKGWLKLGRNYRVKDRSLKAFFEEHRDEVNWARVDRAWVDEVIGNATSGESEDGQFTERGTTLPGSKHQDRTADFPGAGSGPRRAEISRRV